MKIKKSHSPVFAPKFTIRGTNETTKFQVQQSDTTVVFDVDTTNARVGVGVVDPDTKLEVLNAGDQLKLSFDGTDNAVFAVDTNGDLSIDPSGTYVNIGKAPQNDKQLRFYQGSSGGSGNVATIRADFNNLYLTNDDGRVLIEKATDESHALFIQEAGSPFQGVAWWFDGSSGGGTGVWMASATDAGDINMKVAGTSGSFDFQVLNLSSTPVFQVRSDGQVNLLGTQNVIQQIVKGNASQNVNLQEWHNSSGNQLFAVNQTGSLVLWQQANGTFNEFVSIRADFDNLFLTNDNGRIFIEKAADEAHSLGIQEASSPFEKVSWWFDGSSGTGTGVWMQASANAGDINLKLGAADAATYDLKVVDLFDRDVATINSLGGASFNILLKDADFIIAGDTEANLFRLDAGTDEVRMGDWDTNYSAFEKDGTLKMVGAATVFKDINMGAAVLTRPAVSQPDEVNFVDEAGADTGIASLGFAVGEKVSGNFELQHDYKEGTDLVFHVHWQGSAAPTGTDKVKWQLTYTVAQLDATLDATTTIVIETDFDTQYEFKASPFPTITGTNFNIENQFLFTLERIAASAAEYGGDAIVATVGIHYEVDTVGSRQVLTK